MPESGEGSAAYNFPPVYFYASVSQDVPSAVSIKSACSLRVEVKMTINKSGEHCRMSPGMMKSDMRRL